MRFLRRRLPGKFLLGTLLLAGLASGPLHPAAAWATGVGVQPANVELVVSPGSTVRRVVRVGNLRTDRSQRFLVGLAEWTLDDQGKLKLLPPASDSATSWVRFTPAKFTLGPAEAQNVVVEIEVPVRVPEAKERRFALLVSNPPSSPDRYKGKSGVINRFQTASLFYLTAEGLEPQPAVESVAWDTRDPKSPAIRARVSNRGRAHARFMATTVFEDEDGKVVFQGESNIVLVEGQSRDWESHLKLPPLKAGRYAVTWRVFSAFDPKRPSERSGELLETREWSWESPAPSRKPS